MENHDELDLANRTGLPDALRVLLQEHPRDGWTGHANFDGLVRFWLDRHMMFRKLTATLRSESEAVLDGRTDPRKFGTRLVRLGGMFVQELHGHHQIEDMHYFPPLSAAEPSIARGFEILDRDHHAIDGHLGAFAEDANAVLRAVAEAADHRSAAGRFLERTNRLDGFLDRHLIDEEELIVPVILRHGSGLVGH